MSISAALKGVVSSVFSTGPDDSLLKVDGFGTTPTETLSKLSTAPGSATGPTSFLDKLTGGFKNSGMDLADITRIVKIGEKGVGLDPSEALRALDRSLGTSISGIESLNSKVKTDALQSLAKLAGFPGLSTLVGQAGAAYAIFDGARTDSALGLMKAIARLTGNDALGGLISGLSKDSLLGSLLTEALALGVPDAIDQIWGAMKDKDAAKQRLIASLPSVVLRCDLASLRKIIGYIGAEAVLAKMPDTIMYLLAGYRFPTRTKVTDYPELKTYLVDTILMIDTKWMTTKRKGVDISSLKPFTRISRDARLLLLSSVVPAHKGTDPLYKTPVLIAPSYTQTDIRQLGKKMFPVLGHWGLIK